MSDGYLAADVPDEASSGFRFPQAAAIAAPLGFVALRHKDEAQSPRPRLRFQEEVAFAPLPPPVLRPGNRLGIMNEAGLRVLGRFHKGLEGAFARPALAAEHMESHHLSPSLLFEKASCAVRSADTRLCGDRSIVPKTCGTTNTDPSGPAPDFRVHPSCHKRRGAVGRAASGCSRSLPPKGPAAPVPHFSDEDNIPNWSHPMCSRKLRRHPT